MKFKLRIDFQSTKEGILGGLPFQDTDWHEFVADCWETAKIEGLNIFNKFRTYDCNAPQYIQGGVIMLSESQWPESEKMIQIKIN